MDPSTRQQVMRLLERVRLWELHPVRALTEIFELLEKEVSPTPPDTGVTLLGPPSVAQIASLVQRGVIVWEQLVPARAQSS